MAETLFYGSKNLVGIGSVGIGITNPANTLHVSGGRTRFVAGSETYALGVGYSEASAGLYYIGATNSATPDMVFSQVGGSERMRITNAGNVGIGTASPGVALDVYGTNTGNSFLNAQAIGNSGGSLFFNSNSANGHSFFVQGVGKFYVNTNAMSPWTDNNISLGSSGGRYTAVWAVNGAIQTSDSRFKDSTPLNYGLGEILQANTILYSWKTQASLPDDNPEKNFKYFGVCADELAEIMPELCYNEDANVAVQINYSELVPVCINAIKELSAQNQALEARLAALEARLGPA